MRLRILNAWPLLLVLAGLSVFSPFTVSALSPKQKNLYDNNILQYDLESCGDAADTGSTTLSGNNNGEKVFNYFIDKGFTNVQAAGITGNLEQESKFDPTIFGGGGGMYFGLAQWSPGRRAGLEDLAAKQGKSREDLGVQLDYVMQELRDPYYKSVALDPIKASSNLGEIVFIFVRYYEVATDPSQPRGVQDYDQRLIYAKQWLRRAGGSGGGGAPPATSPGQESTSGVCESGGGGSFTSEGYAFPVWAEKKSDYGISGASQLPCPGICHHDQTPALDLSVKFRGSGFDGSEGAPVYAISDGVLTSVNHNNQRPTGYNQCNSVTFTSSKDSFIYWHGHLKRDTSVVTGKRVRVGEKIGNVGPTACADNTLPHLHISRVPAGSSPDSEGARDRGLVEIINKLYEKLPD